MAKLRRATLGVDGPGAAGAQQQAIPHPLWFAVLTTVTYLPMTVIGAKALGEAPGATGGAKNA